MSDRVSVLTVILKPEVGAAQRVMDELRGRDDVVDVLHEVVPDDVIGGNRYIHAHGLDEINLRAKAGFRVAAAWSYGAATIALMEKRGSPA